MNERDPDRIIIKHASRFTMVNTRSFEAGTDGYVLPSQCEQIFYSEVPSRGDWSFLVRYNPIGSPIKYNVVEEYDIEEDEEVELDIGDDVLEDEIDDAIIENDIDDYDDMANPFNVDFELDVTLNKELDEEEDQGHWNVWGMRLYIFYYLLIKVFTYNA